ncbi:hypothetical protein vBVpaMR16F_31 [Vibrio phage vB_VpaM_R16F]|nr:hypothetical protein vBVpaMR16F_31 [Vibrio phage vB_VpaM_R16F]
MARGYHVYIIKNFNGRMTYIGQSVNLDTRIHQHLDDKIVKSVEYYTLTCKRDMDALENYLIYKYLPELNIVCNITDIEYGKEVYEDYDKDLSVYSSYTTAKAVNTKNVKKRFLNYLVDNIDFFKDLSAYYNIAANRYTYDLYGFPITVRKFTIPIYRCQNVDMILYKWQSRYKLVSSIEVNVDFATTCHYKYPDQFKANYFREYSSDEILSWFDNEDYLV